MSRRRRVSRALIGLLSVTIALGLVFWLHNLSRTKAAPQTVTKSIPPPPPAASPVVKSAAAETANPPEPAKATGLITQTPFATKTALTPPTTPTVTPVVQTLTAGATPTPPASSAQPANRSDTAASSATPLVDAQAKIAADDYLAARDLLNTSLTSGKLSAADAKAAKLLLNQVNEVVVFSARKFASDTVGGVYSVKPGDRMERIARQYEVTWELLSRINNNLQPSRMQAGKDLKVLNGPFHAVVDKSDFTLEIWLGNPGESGAMYVTSFPVGLGADDSTPTGTWIVETQKKLKNPTYFSPRGEGVIAADDPDNPLGEYWIGLTGIDGHAVGKQSYGIHGTIRPDSIGKQESMGCVRLLNDDVAKVFELLVEGKSTVMVRE
ncbi:MAG TPA: L,D-transpeptidase family protein [Tepidisphaeraceae bacterium]|nr:L,D-transpeptidase family protein [Tepidisphaeraceae bacterium]